MKNLKQEVFEFLQQAVIDEMVEDLREMVVYHDFYKLTDVDALAVEIAKVARIPNLAELVRFYADYRDMNPNAIFDYLH